MPDIKDHSPDEFLEAFRADPTNAPLALYAGAALDAAGRREEALIVWTFGDDANRNLRVIHKHPEAQGDLRAHSLRADQAIREHFTSMHQTTLDMFQKAHSGADIHRIQEGIWVQQATKPFEFRTPHQRPMTFYIPDLPAHPVAPTDDLPWVRDIEAGYSDILAEYEQALADDATQYPYVPDDVDNAYWDNLRGKMDWSALYLYFKAERTPEADHFPKTLEILSKAPLLVKNGAAMEMFFSRLKPGAHIPAHTGLTNSRLTVHLPIIVPNNCEIRVGNEIHTWRQGKVIAFDDSFEHEAWNRSDTDRVVLIFETHHPDLTKVEIDAIGAVYAAFDEWIDGRAEAIGLRPNENQES